MDAHTSAPSPAKKSMHGALKFILMMIAGGSFAFIATPCCWGVIIGVNKSWTLKEQYSYAIAILVSGAILFFVLAAVAGLWLKRWGFSGFFFGVSATLTAAIFIAEIMKMFDAPK